MKTYTTIINHPSGLMFIEMLDYCRDNHLSIIKVDTTDIYDISFSGDIITKFIFTESSDAMLFKLKYGEYNGIKKNSG